MNVTGSQIGLLGQVLEVASLRHRVIAQNIANLNTPFYQRLALSLDEGTSPGTASVADKPEVVFGQGGAVRADGNNVSLEQEMRDLDKNHLLHDLATQILTSRLGTLRAAISGQ